MKYIIAIVIIWIIIYFCGFFSASFFARFSDTGAVTGWKNYLRMQFGLWNLKRTCPTSLKEKLLSQLKETQREPITLDKVDFDYFSHVSDRQLWNTLYAFMQKLHISYIEAKKRELITLYNGRTLVDTVRDVKNIVPQPGDEKLSSLEKRVLASSKCKRDDLAIIDHAYIRIMQERHGENAFIIPRDKDKLAYTIFLYGNGATKKDTLHLLQRKRHFISLSRLIESTDNAKKE